MNTSPVWTVGEWSLSDDFGKVAQQWNAIRRLLGDAEEFVRRDPAVSGWSCGEQAGHLALVTNWVAHGIEENLAHPERDADGRWSEHTELILREGDFPRGVAQSPPRVDPSGRPKGDFLSALDDDERRWYGLQERADEIVACPARFPHFALGYMTSSEWVRFCALHSAHHLAVVRDITGL